MSTAAPPVDRGQRTYYVSDERLRAFAQLTYAQRLQWVEQCALFVRMGQLAMGHAEPLARPHADTCEAKPLL